MTSIPLAPNSFKAALGVGQRQLGIWSSLCSPISAEILADAGFDWILFDSEHSPIEIAALLPLLQASARATGNSAVRIAWNDPVMIKRVLDLGAQTIFAPFIQSADEARDLVASCRYPPKGKRGVAGSTRASRYGRTKDYISRANDEICIVAQIETLDAIENIEAIANVEGIDGIFVGPSDLSASMGFPAQAGHPQVQSVLRDCAKRIRKAGKPPGILATNSKDAKRYFDWGYIFVAAGVDVALLTKAVDTLITEFED